MVFDMTSMQTGGPTHTWLQLGPVQQVPDFLQDTIAQLIAFLPRLVGALVILLIGWIVGRAIAAGIRRIAVGIDLDERAAGTPVRRFLGDREDALARALGKIGAYYVYFLAILAAADALAVEILSQFVSRAVSYLPAFIAGLVIIILGFILADFLATAIERGLTATDTRYTSPFADGMRVFLYFTAIVIGLQTMNIEVEILLIFARGLAYGLGAALALGAGIAIGLGANDYVSEHIDQWTGQAEATADAVHEEQSTNESDVTDTSPSE